MSEASAVTEMSLLCKMSISAEHTDDPVVPRVSNRLAMVVCYVFVWKDMVPYA